MNTPTAQKRASRLLDQMTKTFNPKQLVIDAIEAAERDARNTALDEVKQIAEYQVDNLVDLIRAIEALKTS